MSRKPSFLVILTVCSFAILLGGCIPEGGLRPPSSVIKELEAQRQQYLETLKAEARTTFLFASLTTILVTFFGHSVVEAMRRFGVACFKLSTEAQAGLAKSIYGLICAAALIPALFDSGCSPIRSSVIILVAASCVPFYRIYLPGIYGEDPRERRAALGQLKTFFLLIAVFFIIMKFLSPEGIGDLSLGLPKMAGH